MVKLTTSYLGLTLKSPLVVSASPLSLKVSNVRAMEDAGAGAVVLHSLFEEQITRHDYGLDYLSRRPEDPNEPLGPFPALNAYPLGPHGYLAYIRQLKQIIKIPIIASLNGFTTDTWIRYAQLIEKAGADALELNTYFIASEPEVTGEQIEQMYLDLVTQIKQSITIPVAIKLSPYFSSVANMLHRLDEVGVNGVVLFNRFYQPDIDLEKQEVVPNLVLSTSTELRLRLLWVAILYNQIQADMAITGGVHTAADALKAIMAGARVAMMTSALLQYGIGYLANIHDQIKHWLTTHGYTSIQEVQGVMSQTAVHNPHILEQIHHTYT